MDTTEALQRLRHLLLVSILLKTEDKCEQLRGRSARVRVRVIVSRGMLGAGLGGRTGGEMQQDGGGGSIWLFYGVIVYS